MDQDLYRKTKNLAAGNGDADEKIDIDMKLAEDSPYPEVRAAVPNTDDPSIPCVHPWCHVAYISRILFGCGQFLSYFVQLDPVSTCCYRFAGQALSLLL